MVERAELQRSNFMISKAEARLDAQRALVEQLSANVDFRFTSLARELLSIMQDKVVIMRRVHETMFGTPHIRVMITAVPESPCSGAAMSVQGVARDFEETGTRNGDLGGGRISRHDRASTSYRLPAPPRHIDMPATIITT